MKSLLTLTALVGVALVLFGLWLIHCSLALVAGGAWMYYEATSASPTEGD